MALTLILQCTRDVHGFTKRKVDFAEVHGTDSTVQVQPTGTTCGYNRPWLQKTTRNVITILNFEIIVIACFVLNPLCNKIFLI